MDNDAVIKINFINKNILFEKIIRESDILPTTSFTEITDSYPIKYKFDCTDPKSLSLKLSVVGYAKKIKVEPYCKICIEHNVD